MRLLLQCCYRIFEKWDSPSSHVPSARVFAEARKKPNKLAASFSFLDFVFSRVEEEIKRVDSGLDTRPLLKRMKGHSSWQTMWQDRSLLIQGVQCDGATTNPSCALTSSLHFTSGRYYMIVTPARYAHSSRGSKPLTCFSSGLTGGLQHLDFLSLFDVNKCESIN